ncbi:MAG TPA: polyhydroxyalkanoic acid system family protein [Accumulibacter sp.]|jgi:putative polyhydroxyalkanoate system protein|nr:polyhydroxyalkanoic acid system family protein [Accumulibacter sp.]HQC80529.1 polyhydroxyalkanoic acid system family protein [Accumulibacter sp.]
MSDIILLRQHGKSRAAARAAAEHLTTELAEKFDLTCTWDSEATDVAHFSRPGVSGMLSLDDRNVEIRIRLSFLFLALKPTIEREAHKYFDENFPTTT